MAMNLHDELDMLSAYLDGELDAPERARLDSHLPTCAECRTTLDAIRVTVADLATLPIPEPTPQDSWALRSAIRRERRPVRRWQRLAIAAGGVAAAAVATLAIALGPGSAGDSTGGTAALGGQRAFDKSAVAGSAGPAILQAGNYDQQTAHAELLSVARLISPGSAPSEAAGAGTSTVAPNSFVYSASTESSAQPPTTLARERAPVEAIEHCADVVRSSSHAYLEPVQYEVATYENKPAFLLFFYTQERYELWVMQRSDCAVLYFAQAV